MARAYVSGATTEKERTGAMAGLSACQAIGFILGPGERTAGSGSGGLGCMYIDVDIQMPPWFWL